MTLSVGNDRSRLQLASELPCFGLQSHPHVKERLETVFGASRAEVTRWAKERVQTAQLRAQEGVSQLHRDQAQLEELNAQLDDLRMLAEVATQVEEDGTRFCKAMQKKNSISPVEEFKYKDNDKENVNEYQRPPNTQLAEIDAFLGLYARRLGLEIRRSAPHTVDVVFTLIDQINPSREFSFTLGLQGLKNGEAIASPTGYHISNCKPFVPQLNALSQRLNEDQWSRGALPAFICGMRRAFIAAATGTLCNGTSQFGEHT